MEIIRLDTITAEQSVFFIEYLKTGKVIEKEKKEKRRFWIESQIRLD